ncbi:MAG: DUF1499 domain-containing protein [Betaproteobacteria bacterium]|nr:MAG: DUF1499 domain-containing protein [Betaproteobacteria bacterium]
MIVWLRPLAMLLALAALLMLALSGPGVRFDVWSYRTGLTVFRWTAYVAIAAALVAAIALAIPKVRARGLVLPMVALLVGLAVLYVPLRFLQSARAVPPINDITTDTDNPPRYMTAARAYPGAEFARQQRAAYPDIAPMLLAVPPRDAFAKAVAAAEAMGWEVVGRDAAAGTIEAVDTTKWFGFKDDIAVRVTPTLEGGSRIDIRSKSRVGRSDIGTNARRIRAYAERLK